MAYPDGGIANAWLNDFAKNYSSQFGEDGIIERILEIIPDHDRWCVEFGAWDGVHLSNTRHLIMDRSYSAVLLEGDRDRCESLKQNYANVHRVIALNRVIGFNNQDNLDSILAATPVPRNFDLLSIDIDGNDYHVWRATRVFRPKIIVIEFNPTIPDAVSFVQNQDGSVMHGSSLLALCELAKEMAYELVATTFSNAVFVDAQYYSLFRIRDNSVHEMRADRSAVTYMFQGYDGTMIVSGAKRMPWHGIPIHPACVQVLPRLLRKYPDDYTPEERTLYHAYTQLFAKFLNEDPLALRHLVELGEPPREVTLDAEDCAHWNVIQEALHRGETSA